MEVLILEKWYPAYNKCVNNLELKGSIYLVCMTLYCKNMVTLF